MISNLIQSLWITLLGMGLVFIAIILLWWLMAFMTAVHLERKTPSKEQTEDIEEIEKKRKAAGIAVSVAFALAHQAEAHISIFPLPPTAVVSAWQLSRRTDNLNKQGIVRR